MRARREQKHCPSVNKTYGQMIVEIQSGTFDTRVPILTSFADSHQERCPEMLTSLRPTAAGEEQRDRLTPTVARSLLRAMSVLPGRLPGRNRTSSLFLIQSRTRACAWSETVCGRAQRGVKRRLHSPNIVGIRQT